jgi:hypothetical protein
MATFPNIERYYESLAELIEAGGSDVESFFDSHDGVQDGAFAGT